MLNNETVLYNSFSAFCKKRFGGELRRICLDGGFTCPNRDGKCGTGGCIFCGERGAGERIDRPQDTIREQVEYHSALYANRRSVKGFAAYFQSFTSTYAPVEILRQRYDSALIDSRIAALIIGTRPDCVDEDVARLLGSYTEKYWVCVELGLQTANDSTAELINRGYKSAEFTRAVGLLRKYGVDVTAHVMAGLPGECKADVLNTIRFINEHDVHGIKLHSLYVMKNTALEKLYLAGGYVPLELEEYADIAAEAIARMRPDIVVHRIVSDCTAELLAAPQWCAKKRRAVEYIRDTMARRGLRQGVLYNG